MLRHFNDIPYVFHICVEINNTLDKLNKIVEVSKELRCGVTASITEKVAEIKRLEGKYSVHVLCEALQIPRGTYYNRKMKGDLPSSYELADRELSVLIREIFYQSNERFGRNPIKYKLQERGYQVSKMRISLLMKEMGLQVKVAPYTLEHKKSLSRNKFRKLFIGILSGTFCKIGQRPMEVVCLSKLRLDRSNAKRQS